MADKPSRALVVLGDGHAAFVSPSHANLHAFASRASCGFLSLRTPPQSEIENDRVVGELAQLLDAYDFYMTKYGNHDKADADVNKEQLVCPTISQRFMGLKAALVTNCPDSGSFGRNLGLNVLRLHELIKQNESSELLPEVSDDIISKLLLLLGFSGGDVLEKYDFDLVFLHVRFSEKSKSQREKVSINSEVDWLEKLVGGIMLTVQPGSLVASRLHFSILLSYGTVSKNAENCSLVLNSSTETNSDLSLLRPRQSYTMKGGRTLTDIRHHHPILVAQLQEGVTRRDMVTKFSFEEFKKHGVNLAILADRFLHEVAFKLWKAPKYGA
ncbi:hypothetical protein J5N97_007500 [Dioscorea zingiberensis]|uniref:AT5G11810-like protein n=1 Tax=Dioscorea zingiberensis TaxID=325984 RepID=A0A9D5DCQ7_9LILI|nr:hypothetical protein J5N97_007500 [Dioscorea zingiberensis]